MPHETRHDKTRQDKTRRNKTRQSKAGQNKTKQNEIRQNLAELDWAESDQTRQKMERKTHTYTHKKKNKRAARIILGDFFSAQDRMRSTKQHLVNAAWSPKLTHALWCISLTEMNSVKFGLVDCVHAECVLAQALRASIS